jgi:hypothetical protein
MQNCKNTRTKLPRKQIGLDYTHSSERMSFIVRAKEKSCETMTAFIYKAVKYYDAFLDGAIELDD